jgi:inward rectifier potassium channel
MEFNRYRRRHPVRVGRSEIETRGLADSVWTDRYHRAMTASWPVFFGTAAAIFVIFNAVFAFLYWLGNEPIANVTADEPLGFFYFSVETLATVGYGDMHPQTHYGHFIATVELFTGIFSMSLMTGLIFARFARPNARLLFAENPVVSNYEGKPTLMVRFVNERHNIIGNANAKLWLLRNVVSQEGQTQRRFYELPLLRNEHPALALSWTLYHVLDEKSPLYGLDADAIGAIKASLVVVVTGYDVVAAQTIHARRSYDHTDIRFGRHYANILDDLDDGRLRINYARFHETLDG